MLNFRFAQEYIQLDLFDDFGSEDRNTIVQSYIDNISESKAKPILDTYHLSRLIGYSEYFLFWFPHLHHIFIESILFPKRPEGIED